MGLHSYFQSFGLERVIAIIRPCGFWLEHTSDTDAVLIVVVALLSFVMTEVTQSLQI